MTNPIYKRISKTFKSKKPKELKKLKLPDPKPATKQKPIKVQTRKSILDNHLEKLEKRIKAAKATKAKIDNRGSLVSETSDNKRGDSNIREKIQDMIDIFNKKSLFYLRGD